MPTSLDLNALRLQRDQLKAQLAQVGDMRTGSLVPRYRKCGKPTCHCAQKGSKGHGPSYSLTHPIAGKTVTRVIPAGAAVERTRVQLEEYHRFRRLVQQLTTVSEQVCDLAFHQSEPEDNKKNRARKDDDGTAFGPSQRNAEGHGLVGRFFGDHVWPDCR